MTGWTEWLSGITYERPQYFDFAPIWVLASAGILLALLLKWRFRPSRAKDSRQRIFGVDAVWVLALTLSGLMIVALAGPKLDILKSVTSSDNLNIIFGVDSSVSMAIEDVGSSRHKVMVKEITTLVSSPEIIREGDRLTLFSVNENSNWRMPLSTDRGEFLDELSEVEQPGDKIYYNRAQLYTYFLGFLNHITEALDKQEGFFLKGLYKSSLPWSSYPTIVILFSDGDSNDGSLVTPLALLQKRKIKVYPVGIGSVQGGSVRFKIPAEDESKKFETMTVQSKLNMKMLDLIKDQTGGKSYSVSSASSQVQSFLGAVISENRRPTISVVSSGDSDVFWWDLLAIPSLLIVAWMVKRFVF